MIEQIQLCLKHRLKAKGPQTIRFKPGVNVLVGPNGSGKSTILRAIHACGECVKQCPDEAPILHIDPERMNPHHPDFYPASIRELVLQARGVFSSHGEILRAALFSLPVPQGALLLVDEPEAGQDLEGVERIRSGFDRIVASGGQVIAASHHPLILRGSHLVELVPGYAQKIQEAFCRPADNPASPVQP